MGSKKSPMPPPPDMSGFMADFQKMGQEYAAFSEGQGKIGGQMFDEMGRQFQRGDEMFGIQNELLGTAKQQLANQDRSFALQDDMMGLMRDQLGNQGRLYDIADNQMAGQDRMFGIADQQLGNQGRMFGVMDRQLGLQDQQLGYQQNALGLQNQMLGQMGDQMALGQERFAALNPISTQLTQGAADAQTQALNQARDQYDFYQNTYRPAEQRMVDDAMRYNSEGERQRMAQMAGADVEQALATQRGAGMRALERMGVNPNSGRMMQLMAGDGLQAAKLRAGAENNARVAAEEKGFNRLATAAAAGARLPGNAAQAIQASALSANAGANTLGAADKIASLYTDDATRMGALGAQFGNQAVQFGNVGAGYGSNAISAGNSANAFGNTAISAANSAGGFAGRAIDANNAATNVARTAQGFGQLGQGFGQEAQRWADVSRGFTDSARNFGALGNDVNRTGLDAGRVGLDAYRNQLSGMRLQDNTIDSRSDLAQQDYSNRMGQWQANEQRKSSRAAGIGKLVGTVGGFMLGGPAGAMIGGALAGGLTGGGGGAQAAFSNTSLGSSGFGSGLAYGNQDLGMNFSRGGQIQGPGTGTSDDVRAVNEDSGQPIRLSNGEYVLPAQTVRAIGMDKLDQIVEKTNGKPPVHRQYDRRGQKSRKKALSR